MIIKRQKKIDEVVQQGKVAVIYGPRRAGKTTLLDEFLKTTSLKYKLDSGENIRVQQILSSSDFTKILPHVQNYELYALDEAQKIPNVGQGLKIIVDQIPKIRVIATGSSSFELAGQVGEPLTGRKNVLRLFPLSQTELLQTVGNESELKSKLPESLIFGGYPEVVLEETFEKKCTRLEELTQSYLLKDILELEKVKNSKILLDLLTLIAFQIGNEVSLTEIGTQLGLDKGTVARYLDLLEKSFILYNLRGYSRNLRKEITKKSKYYFLDNGIRNAIINNFNPLESRNDTGTLWENFLVAERLKIQGYKPIYSNNYFWRTWDQKEVDWIEEREGRLYGYEFKWSVKKRTTSKEFLTIYKEASLQTIHPDNFLEFLAYTTKTQIFT